MYQSPFKTNKTTPNVSEFFAKLVSFRQTVKLLHWAQPDKTDATHAALDEIYDDLDDHIDSLIEKYQGVHGIVAIDVPKCCADYIPLAYVEEMYNCIDKERQCIKESFLQNIIDEIQAVLAKGLYKLKFVKSRA